MRISLNWLKKWVAIPVSVEALVSDLTMMGLEVESIEELGKDLENIVVAKVLDVKPHPNADKLRLCLVDCGETSPLSVVCGASNVKAGIKVAFAKIGAKLPGDFKIRKSKIRGEESHGMICSESELQLAESSEGIMVLPEDAPIGMNFVKYWQLEDIVIEIAITPNRGDCLSILGVARELAAAYHVKMTPPEFKIIQPAAGNKFPIKLKADAQCPQYAGMIIRGINNHAKTPLWIKNRLEKAEIRTISAVVDVTNYIMLELGQPMHAFDLDRLDGEIQVRFAKDGEEILLLDEEKIVLTPDMLVIADAKKPVALAGVMGGLDSAVLENTPNIFLESALFMPSQISKAVRYYGIHSDSSYRFERGVDPLLQEKAIMRAAQLITEICGGIVGPVHKETYSNYLPQEKNVSLNTQKLQKILGVHVPEQKITAVFDALNFPCKTQDNILEVSVPAYRYDIEKEIDLIEEVARIHGYNQIPFKTQTPVLPLQWEQESDISEAALRQSMKFMGYREIISYSFINSKKLKILNHTVEPITLMNPISEAMDVMRPSLFLSLLEVYQYNSNRQQDDIRIFEVGTVYYKTGEEIKQEKMIGGLISGKQKPEQWGQKTKAVDFFDLKGDIEQLYLSTKRSNSIIFKRGSHEGLHPGQTMALYLDERKIGHAGKIHPEIAQQLDIPDDIYLFELQVEALKKGALPSYRPLSKYPSVRRDLAIVVDKNIEVNDILQAIYSQIGNNLVEISVFDLFEDKKIGESKKSLGIGLILQDLSHTLKDDQVNKIIQKLVVKLNQLFNAELRD